MCWHVPAPEKVRTPKKVPTRADTSRCRHVPTSLILIIWTFCLQSGMCWHVSAPEKVPTPGKVPTRADTSRCWHVPTRADIPDTNHMDFLFANWDVLACLSTWKGADTWEGADTCRHVKVPTRSQILIIWTFCLQTGMCWHVSAPEKVPTPKKVPTRLGADTCWHVPTSLILIIWTFCFQTGMCWHVSAPEKVPTPGKVPTRADTSRCWHVPTCADIPDTNDMDFLFANWDVLACVSTWKSADT